MSLPCTNGQYEIQEEEDYFMHVVIFQGTSPSPSTILVAFHDM